MFGFSNLDGEFSGYTTERQADLSPYFSGDYPSAGTWADEWAGFGRSGALQKSLATAEPSEQIPGPKRSTPMKKLNAKLAIRIAILTVGMFGMFGTFAIGSVQPVPAADGGPIVVCPPRQVNCN